MSRRHPKSRKERIALRSRLGNKLSGARDRVAKKVNRRGKHIVEEKSLRWKPWDLASE